LLSRARFLNAGRINCTASTGPVFFFAVTLGPLRPTRMACYRAMGNCYEGPRATRNKEKQGLCWQYFLYHQLSRTLFLLI